MKAQANTKRLPSLLLALGLAASLLWGCGQSPAPASSVIPAEASAPAASAEATPEAAPGEEAAADDLVDMAGRAVALAGPAERVVALMPADCEIIYALGAEDALVGRGEYCDWPAEITGVDMVQSGAETNLEQILALAPDAVIMSMMAQTVEQVEALESAGVAVVISDAQDIEGVYTAIELIGRVLGREAEAEALAGTMQADFAALAAGVPGGDAQTIYFEVSPLEWGLWTTGTGTFMDEIAALLNLENLFGDVAGWAEVSQEQVIERNPEYIVTTTMYFGEGPTPEEEVASREGWQAVTAVAEGQIFNADSDEMTRPGPRLVSAARALYEFVYGD